jgi:hypothetical protein
MMALAPIGGSDSSLNWDDRKNCGIFNLGRLAENTILLAGEQAKHDQYGQESTDEVGWFIEGV